MPIINISNLQQFTAVNLTKDQGAIAGPIQIPQCCEIGLVWSNAAGKPVHNVLHGSYSGGFAGTVAQANSILTSLTTGGTWTAMAAFMTTNSALSFVTFRDLNSINNPLITSTSTGAAGTSVSTALPSETAVVITLRTARTGRANRGRIYVPNFASNATAAGDLVAAATITAIQNWANVIPGALSAQGFTFCIGQKARAAYTGSTGALHPARAATTIAITGQSVRDNHWDSQRRRGLR